MLFNKNSLNKDIPIPLYFQLKEILLEDIKSGKFSTSDPIPTELEISDYFNISRPTVRQALNELVNEGYLYRVKGKGTFVTKPKIYQKFTEVIDNFNDEMKKKGLTPKTRVLDINIQNASEEVAEKLGIAEGDKVAKLKRLRFANDEPILIVTTFIPLNLFPDILEIDFTNNSLYQILDERGLKIKRVRRIFEARKVSEKDAKLLEMHEGDPIHYFETVAFLEGDVPIEYSMSKYRGDRNKFTVEIKRE